MAIVEFRQIKRGRRPDRQNARPQDLARLRVQPHHSRTVDGQRSKLHGRGEIHDRRIVSHHGQYEYGSPKLPMTLEAVALHHLDNLDAKMHSFHQLMRDDPNVESSWTAYNQNLGRKLFKGQNFTSNTRPLANAE